MSLVTELDKRPESEKKPFGEQARSHLTVASDRYLFPLPTQARVCQSYNHPIIGEISILPRHKPVISYSVTPSL